jgi:hypothetical protein
MDEKAWLDLLRIKDLSGAEASACGYPVLHWQPLLEAVLKEF